MVLLLHVASYDKECMPTIGDRWPSLMCCYCPFFMSLEYLTVSVQHNKNTTAGVNQTDSLECRTPSGCTTLQLHNTTSGCNFTVVWHLAIKSRHDEKHRRVSVCCDFLFVKWVMFFKRNNVTKTSVSCCSSLGYPRSAASCCCKSPGRGSYLVKCHRLI